MGIAPDQMHGIAQRGAVRGIVARQHSNGLKTVAQLEAHDLVTQVAGLHRIHVILSRRILLMPPCKPRQAPAEHNALEAQLRAELAARGIEPLAEAMPTVAAVDHDLVAVEPVAFRLMRAAVAIGGNALPGMRRQRAALREPDARAVPDHVAVVHGDQMPLGEPAYLGRDLLDGVIVLLAIRDRTQPADRRHIAQARRPDIEAAAARTGCIAHASPDFGPCSFTGRCTLRTRRLTISTAIENAIAK